MNEWMKTPENARMCNFESMKKRKSSSKKIENLFLTTFEL
jgi:hypothetical protein